jgi:hypothetical protein
MTSDQNSSQPVPRARRLQRRSALRLWAAALAGAVVLSPRSGAGPLPSTIGGLASVRAAPLAVDSGPVRLRVRFDGLVGAFELVGLTGYDTDWVPEGAPLAGALWIDAVRVDEQPPVSVDGTGGLELLSKSRRSLSLVHRQTGLQLDLEYVVDRGGAIGHRLGLANGRSEGRIRVGSAATISLPLWAGEWTEALAADDAPNSWTMLHQELPATFGNHELRNAVGGVYPLVRLASADGGGIIVAVSTATAWRVDVALIGDLRLLRAGEYQSDLTLAPGQRAQLPDVVTIFYRDGPDGANRALQRYLEGISSSPPVGWSNTPPTVFNTWFGYGTGLSDDGSDGSDLRTAARIAADAGAEVMVVDAGWYLGNPVPGTAGDGGREPRSVRGEDRPGQQRPEPPARGDNFTPGLGTWVENPSKWRARSGDGGSQRAGLQNFSDYVRNLDVRRPDGGVDGKMRFGLWIEPERFDPEYQGSERVPASWALPGTSILDFSRPEVVDGMTARVQRVITDYGADYLKIDANADVIFDANLGRTGHLWTRWSAGFEQLLQNLRRANPGLYVEHSASGLKRYWIGLPRLAHSTWLDDDVRVDNVGYLLDVTDALMLPRQKTVLVAEDLSRYAGEAGPAGADAGQQPRSDIFNVIRAYWGGDHRNGGTIGFSSRLERWGPNQQRAAGRALETWKREIRAQD